MADFLGKETKQTKQKSTSLPMSNRSIIIIPFLIMLCVLSTKTTRDSSFSCPVSPQTVGPVDSCPVTEEGWKERAAIKNCAAYADQCDEPVRLEYHCVISPFINETLEVCAYVQNIVNGFCVEYNIVGNIIQSNPEASCTAFTSSPCPSFYRSNEAYKYPECYYLVKISSPGTSSASTSNSRLSYKGWTSYFSYAIFYVVKYMCIRLR